MHAGELQQDVDGSSASQNVPAGHASGKSAFGTVLDAPACVAKEVFGNRKPVEQVCIKSHEIVQIHASLTAASKDIG